MKINLFHTNIHANPFLSKCNRLKNEGLQKKFTKCVADFTGWNIMVE